MPKKNKYTATCYVIFTDNGTTVPFNELTAEEIKAICRSWSERLSRSMSDYCQSHPGAFATIPGKLIK